MFTGIIEETGIIRSIHQGGDLGFLVIEAEKVLSDVKTGDSLSVNGICLTVVSFDTHSFTADVMPETMRRSTLGTLSAGSRVNLERAMRLSDRLGGHLVSGHIDGTGMIRSIRREENAVWISVSAEKNILRYIVEKGSVALDGISLTVTRVDEVSFDVSVIPHTHDHTTMGMKRTGQAVNIECDIIAKYVEKLMGKGKEKGNITPEFLAEHGFLG